MLTLGERLKDERVKKKLSTKKLSEMTGISVGALNSYENDEKIGSWTNLYKIATALEVSTDYLLGKDECTTLDNEEIHKKLGLSGQAIERLENVIKFLEKDFTMKEKLDACNFIIENFNNSDFLENLYSYMFNTFAFPDPKDDKMVVFATEIVSGTGDGNIKTSLLNSKDINDAFLVKTQNDILKLKNMYLDKLKKECD